MNPQASVTARVSAPVGFGFFDTSVNASTSVIDRLADGVSNATGMRSNCLFADELRRLVRRDHDADGNRSRQFDRRDAHCRSGIQDFCRELPSRPNDRSRGTAVARAPHVSKQLIRRSFGGGVEAAFAF